MGRLDEMLDAIPGRKPVVAETPAEPAQTGGQLDALLARIPSGGRGPLGPASNSFPQFPSEHPMGEGELAESNVRNPASRKNTPTNSTGIRPMKIYERISLRRTRHSRRRWNSKTSETNSTPSALTMTTVVTPSSRPTSVKF